MGSPVYAVQNRHGNMILQRKRMMRVNTVVHYLLPRTCHILTILRDIWAGNNETYAALDSDEHMQHIPRGIGPSMNNVDVWGCVHRHE